MEKVPPPRQFIYFREELFLCFMFLPIQRYLLATLSFLLPVQSAVTKRSPLLRRYQSFDRDVWVAYTAGSKRGMTYKRTGSDYVRCWLRQSRDIELRYYMEWLFSCWSVTLRYELYTLFTFERSRFGGSSGSICTSCSDQTLMHENQFMKVKAVLGLQVRWWLQNFLQQPSHRWK